MAIEVRQRVNIYEVDDQEQVDPIPALEVCSHWNRHHWIVLKVGGKSYAVTADDLRAAIENATNTNPF